MTLTTANTGMPYQERNWSHIFLGIGIGVAITATIWVIYNHMDFFRQLLTDITIGTGEVVGQGLLLRS
jgi:hypothetical protein